MLLNPSQTMALNGLCSRDRLDLMDTIDSLRSQGISHYVSLPQIIVCGDQSSGKSSVLEAISGVSFPVKSTLCTRFPTELVLRRNAEVSVKVSIVPHDGQRDDEKEGLLAFHETLEDLSGFAALIDSAQTAMGISTHGKAFSRDLLRVEIAGPDRPHLTIVDLPGLVHSQTKHQTATDVHLIRDVVQAYMCEPRSIILAVVSAKNDIANQVVLQLASAADPGGTRTLGVITKPDCLYQGSPSEALFLSLARNQEVDFRLGWHVLRNLDTEAETPLWTSEGGADPPGRHTLNKRDALERHFFFETGEGTSPIWAGELPHSMLGIDPLRRRLSRVLLGHIVAELPSLAKEIEAKRTDCSEMLALMGQPRVTLDEQRLYLLGISQTFQGLVRSAVDGNYQDQRFFQDSATEHGYQCRIRAVVQNLNETFATDLAQHGHYRHIVEGEEEEVKKKEEEKKKNFQTSSMTASPPPNGPLPTPILITRRELIHHVQDKMHRTKGRELPGLFDPMTITDLYRDQSRPWAVIAQRHVRRVWGACQIFLRHVLAHITDPATGQALLQKIFEPAMTRLRTAVEAKTDDVTHAYQDVHPITYDGRFAEAVEAIQMERRRVQCARIVQAALHCTLEESVTLHHRNFNAKQLVDDLARVTVEPEESHLSHSISSRPRDLRRVAASDALDRMEAYYRVALQRFVDDIAVEAVEVSLVSALVDVLSPVGVYSMAPDLVAVIAGESEDNQARREQLTRKLDVLSRGAETCHGFIGQMDLHLESESDMSPAEETGSDINTDDAVSMKRDPGSPSLGDHHSTLTVEKEDLWEKKKPAEPEPVEEAEPVKETADRFEEMWAAPRKKGKKMKKEAKVSEMMCLWEGLDDEQKIVEKEKPMEAEPKKNVYGF